MKHLPWFRFYHEAIDDVKLQMLAFEDRWHFVAILCLKAAGYLDSDSPLRLRKICMKMGLTQLELESVARRLSEVELIDKDTLQPLAWDERQFISDNSHERVTKYRDKRRGMGLTVTGYLKFKDAVFERDKHACVYCNSDKNLCLDHITPTSQGGGDCMENLATACKSCNSSKAGRTPDQCETKFINKEVEAMWRKHVTVTVTGQDKESEKDSKAEGDKYPQDFEQAWREYPRRPGANKANTFKAWSTRIKTGTKPEDMVDGMRKYAAYVQALGTEPQFIKQPETFFGPGQHFLSDWTPPRTAPRGSRQDQRSAVMAGLEQTGENNARRPSDIDV